MARRTDPRPVRRTHQPAQKKTLIGNVIDMGESLNDTCLKLAQDPTVEAFDFLLFRLEGAVSGIRRFRQALVTEGCLGRDAR